MKNISLEMYIIGHWVTVYVSELEIFQRNTRFNYKYDFKIILANCLISKRKRYQKTVFPV